MSDADDIKAMSFEDAMAELEKVVERIEDPKAPLDQSIALYERGAALQAHCEKKLKDAEMRVEKILAGPDGQAKGAAPFDGG